MRVHLVAKFCSENVVNMIDNYAEICGGKKNMDQCVK